MKYAAQITEFTKVKNSAELILINLDRAEYFPGKESFRKLMQDYIDFQYKILKVYADMDVITDSEVITKMLRDVATMAKEGTVKMRRAEEFISIRELKTKLGL